jgi:S-adenosylmethionine-diacylglycerol 3-amino-3-carboxypropyl transferase
MLPAPRSPVEERSATAGSGRIDERTSFDFIRYANCWEDADVLCEALQPQRGMRILSIASAGDNSLALAADGADVVVADLSAAQLACVELRVAAFRRLDHERVLQFLGIRPSAERLADYALLERDLSPSARGFWSERPEEIALGIIHAGKFEAYFRKFRRYMLPLIHSRRTIEALLEPKEEPARRQFWDKRWNNARWRLLFRIFFSRRLMGALGRDPEFFRYVEGSVADRILQRAEYALTVLPTHANPFLDYIVYGNFPRSLPRYLRPENFHKVRDGLERITLHHGRIDDAAPRHAGGGFDGFNLSDIFEYIDPVASRELYATLLEFARPGARLAYWNTLARSLARPNCWGACDR